jgi:hypothetical protein
MIFARTHADLLMAILTMGLATWGLISGHMPFVLGMAVIGAIGYFVGLVVALCVGLVTLFLGIFTMGTVHGVSSDILVQMVGCLSIARLGFRHKTLKEARQLATTRPHEALPWAMVNEIRTSLAAIRFLLFPLHDERASQELQEATKELSRLEKLFHDLEQNRREE